MRRVAALFAAVVAASGLLVDANVAVAGAANAAIVVTTPTDVVDAGDGLLSLREAVDQANASAGGDTIELGGLTAFLDRCYDEEGPGSFDENGNVEGDLDATDAAGSLTIRDGVVEQRCDDRVLDGITSTVLALQGVTVTGGYAYRPGGAIAGAGTVVVEDSVVTDNESDAAGGGIAAQDVVVRRSSITDNVTTDLFGGGGGGGIRATGSVRIVDSIVSGNETLFAGHGGGVRAPTVIVRRSTITHNNTGSFQGSGGAVIGTRVVITDSTISDNRSPAGVGGIDSVGSVELRRSTIVRNEAPDVANLAVRGPFTSSASVLGEPHGRGVSCRLGGSVVSDGYNVVSVGGRCGLGAGVGDKIRQARLDLRPLGENGGPTPTHLPIGRRLSIVPASRCGATADQRGEARPQGTYCEAGAVEVP